ncbi:MAG: TRAP transporter large permease [Deltaproteobacteria bacterium]|nr:TRAP transporter large permease [Deltaproteobacteria bacterium]
METVFLLSFLVLVALGVPIAFSLCLSVSVILFYFMHMPQILVPQIMYTGIDSFSFMAVPFFMLAGSFMSQGGVARRLVDFASSLVGSLPGGLAQVVAVSGMFFAAISGSSAATTAAIGVIMIDEMEKRGYDRVFSTGVVAAGGTVGIVIPPSITMVVYGAIAGVSVGELFMGGFAPGILMGISMCVLSYIICSRRGWKGVGAFSMKRVIVSFKSSFFALLTPLIIIGGIYGGIFTPTESAAVAAVYAIFVGLFIYKELKLRDFPKIIFSAVISTTMIMFIVGGAKVFGWLLTNLEIPHRIGMAFVNFTSSPIVFLLMMNVLLLILGTLVNASAAVIILTPIFLPVAEKMGIDPLFFGVLMVVNLAIGCITPPVGLDLFVASAITKIPIEKVMKAVTPYLLVLIADLLILTFFPSIITFVPHILR